MAVVIVTGTPGTGKTTVAVRLAKKLGFRYVDVNKVISAHKLSEGYDRKKRCRVVDVRKLSRVLVKLARDAANAGDGVVIDSHLSHYMPSSAVDVCVVTTCDLKLLKRRMKRRSYPDSKISDNLECEAFESCLVEATEAGHDVVVADTGKKVDYGVLMKKFKK